MAGLKQVNGTQEEEPEEEARVSCKDSACIKSWLATTGKCFQCEDFASDYCGNDDAFMESCPKSCKLCSAEAVNCHDDFKVIACKEPCSCTRRGRVRQVPDPWKMDALRASPKPVEHMLCG